MKNTNLKNKKIALYTPYLDVLGGGEKHILSILEVFYQLGGKIYIFWNKNLNKELKKRFNFKFINNIYWLPIKLKTPYYLKNFDYFFYVTDGSYFFSLAKKNYVFSMVPNKKLYQLNFVNKLKLLNYKFIANSQYTANWLKKWQIDSIVIEPYIEDIFFKNKEKKEKIILSVGRFFPHLHHKNHLKIIEAFKKLIKINNAFKDYKLILIGGLKKEDYSYFNKLKNLIKNDKNIILKLNVPFKELIYNYQISTYYWHFTGYGVNENKNPEQVEHFGIAPLEAMASKSIVFCHNSGNPKLIIKNNFNGILFNNSDDLITQISNLEKNHLKKEKIKNHQYKFVKNNFYFNNFKSKILNNLL